MTQDDLHTAIGRAFVERRELEQKIACLRARLSGFGRACAAVAGDGEPTEEVIQQIETASDPREDWAELKKCEARLTEVEKVLR